MEKVPHPSKVEASTTIEVTSKIATKTLATYDMEVTPPIETNVTTPNQTDVTPPTLTNLFVQIDEGFPGGPSDCDMFSQNMQIT